MNNDETARLCFGLLMVGVCVGICIGALGMNSAWKKASIEHKAGQYVIADKISGWVEFKFNDEIKGEK